jgi:hypothetical protein
MSDTLCTGVITKITDGRFDNQYEVEITLADGTKFSGFDGISVYEKKKDGSESKVWPLVQQSKFQGVPFTWQGNVRETDTKGGVKRYATITWAQEDSGDGAWSSAPDSGNTWEPAPSDGWDTPPAKTSSPAPSPEPSRRDETTRQIEAAWALGCLLQFEEYRKDPDLLKKKTHQLIALKHQIAQELS